MLLPPEFSLISSSTEHNFHGLPLVDSHCMLSVASFGLPCYTEITLLRACIYQEKQKTSEFSQLNWAFCLDRSKKFLTNFCTERILFETNINISMKMFEIARGNNICFCFDKEHFSSSLWGKIPSFSERVTSPAALSNHFSAFWVPLSVKNVKFGYIFFQVVKFCLEEWIVK